MGNPKKGQEKHLSAALGGESEQDIALDEEADKTAGAEGKSDGGADAGCRKKSFAGDWGGSKAVTGKAYMTAKLKYNQINSLDRNRNQAYSIVCK